MEDEKMPDEKNSNSLTHPSQKDAKKMRSDFDSEDTWSNSEQVSDNGNDCTAVSTSTVSGVATSATDAENNTVIDSNNDNHLNLATEHNEQAVAGSIEDSMEGLAAEIENQRTILREMSDGVMEAERSIESHEEEGVSSYHSYSSSENTMIDSTDTYAPSSDDEDLGDDAVKKEKPKHNWFLLPEVKNRQYGYPASRVNPSLFQQRCYGSLFSVQKLELMYQLEKHEGCVNSLNFSPDGNYLASGSDDLQVVIWDWRVGKAKVKTDTSHRKNILQTKFLDLEGSDFHLVTGGMDGQVLYVQIRADGHSESRKLGAHKGPCHKLAVLNDQPHMVLSAAEDGRVMRHDIRRCKQERILQVMEPEGKVALNSIDGHPLNSNEFCVAGHNPCVLIYDQRNCSKPLTEFCRYKKTDPKKIQGSIACAVYNHDGSEILASYNDDDIYLFDIDKGCEEFAHRYSGHRNGASIKGVSFFGPHSEFIVSGSDCAHVFFWEKKTEAISQFLLADDNGIVNAVEPHPELPFLATSGLDWDVKLWVPSCEEERRFVDLHTTVKENRRIRNRFYNGESASELQVLWMLWHRLRASGDPRRTPPRPRPMGTIRPDGYLYQEEDEEDMLNFDTSLDEDDDEDEDEEEEEQQSIVSFISWKSEMEDEDPSVEGANSRTACAMS